MIPRGRRWMPRLCFFSVLSLGAVWLCGCDWMPGRPTQAEMPLRPAAVTNFARLYGENCAGCHGVDGRFGPAVAMNNPVYLAMVDDAAMRRAIADGVAGTSMPPFAVSAGGDMTDDQINLVIAGMRRKWSGDPDAAAGAPPYSSAVRGDAARGANVYATYCQKCHGPDGGQSEKPGNPAAGSVVNPSFLALVSDQNLRTIVIAGRPDLGHPDWRNCVPGQPMTAAQVSDVVAWLASKRAPMIQGASYSQQR